MAVKELFPTMEIPHPAQRRMDRALPLLAEILQRVGKPVCYFKLELAENGDGPYVVHSVTTGGQAASVLAGCGELAKMTDLVHTLDYDRDGKPF